MTNLDRRGAPEQLGYVVDDLDAAMEVWRRACGVGPWLVFRNARMDGHCYGEATSVTMDVGLGYLGDVQLELIQQTNDAPSPYRTADGAPRLGAHHVAWLTDDLDSEVEQAQRDGLKLAFRAGNATTQVAYFEDPQAPGILIEAIQGAGMRQMIREGVEAARAWDGRQSVTEIDLGA